MNTWKYEELKENIDNFLDLLECAPETISTSDIKEFFQSDFLRDSNFSNFHSLDNKTKTIISLIRISASYLRYVAYYNISIFAEVKKKYTEDKADDNFFYCMINKDDDSIKLEEFFRDSRHETILDRTPRHLKTVFSHIVSIKNSSLLLFEQIYLMIGSVQHLHFDDKTFKRLNDSITQEDYEKFRLIIDSWNRDIVNELTIIIETFYPTLLYVESITTARTLYYISDDLGAKDVTHKYEFSFVGVIFVILINYILNKNIASHLDHFERCALVSSYKSSFSFPKYIYANGEIENPLDWDYYINWIISGTEAIIDLFKNNQENLLIEENNIRAELGSDENKGGKKPIGNTPNPYKRNGLDMTGDENTNPPIEKPKRHLSVGHDVEAIKKLATYLVKGFTNTRGSLSALVSSTDEKDITINKLIFLFTGNKDYSFDGPYNLTWNAEQVYLKLLIKLLHNLNELATASNAVDKERSDYISDEYIKCNLSGGVWPKVAEAFENIKSAATIRNANYKKNYKDITALINQKRQRDMKLIADMWLKCKDDIDF